MHPSYINCNTYFCYNHHEQQINFNPTNMHSTMKKSSNSPVVGKSLRKDRHSKINTARGPRDRRMRLSLDVAKKFFKLQDMLGFDKASNTIEWLLTNSQQAIQDLYNQQLSCSLMVVSNSTSSASECEVLSASIDDQSTEKTEVEKMINKKKKKPERVVRKSVYVDHSLAKESREKARARARKRATEKRNTKLGYYDGAANCRQFSKLRPNLDQVLMDQNTNRLGSWIPFEENHVQLTDQPEYPSSHFQFKQGNIVGDSSSMMSSNWSPLFNYQHNPGLSHDQHQFSDLQILGKPWEGINN
ncbi:hypothetical protein M8C21_027138 [Ambrosia artemisiifolia]|uniref:Uncharacterized protein n=1 Tax=Ambrosia artemisiifolia TaxID=4212 RepID=A0AAD5BY12_AMBAR|nr:hypothetical protein M8C21_027138 [Ambrosia artemisiifolia]